MTLRADWNGNPYADNYGNPGPAWTPTGPFGRPYNLTGNDQLNNNANFATGNVYGIQFTTYSYLPFPAQSPMPPSYNPTIGYTPADSPGNLVRFTLANPHSKHRAAKVAKAAIVVPAAKNVDEFKPAAPVSAPITEEVSVGIQVSQVNKTFEFEPRPLPPTGGTGIQVLQKG